MKDTRRSSPPDAGAPPFDVRAWIAGMSHVRDDAVHFLNEEERAGRRTVTYDIKGVVVKVRMAPMAGSATWELGAEIDGVVYRVLLPGTTRFVWGAPRGTRG